MMSHDARVQELAEMFRAESMSPKGWVTLKLARIGEVRVHVTSQESCKDHGWNEVWARMGGLPGQDPEYQEFRGSAEKVAKELCKLLQAPSKAVDETARVLVSKRYDGLREPEMAAIYGLDEALVFKAMAFLAEQGVAMNKGDLGWFRV